MKKVSIFLFLLFSYFFSCSLTAAATINGVVTNQSSNPISGASIALIRGSQNVVATTTTAVDGSYTFAGVNPGQYSVRASATGFETQIVGAKANNNQTTTVNFQLLPNPGTISGQVVDAVTSLPISGAAILVSKNNFLIAATTTDSNGNYTIPGLDPGNYIVGALATGYQASLQGVSVFAGQTTILNFSLETRPGSVSGTVSASTTGLPIAGALVEITFNNQVVETTLTDSFGNYSFSDLFPGSYVVIAHADTFQAEEIGVDVQSNQNSVVNFSLDSLPGILAGTVTDSNTTLPIPGAAVLVFSNNVLVSQVLTDPSGNYEIDDLAPGDYHVVVTAANYRTQILSATIISTQTTTLDFSLQTIPSTLQGQITNPLTGQPIRGAFVYLLQNGMFEAIDFTDNNGNYVISTLSPGTYTYTAGAIGFYSVTGSFTVGVGQVITINLSLTPNSPPRNVSGSVIKNRFLLQEDRIHHLQWQASQDPTVLSYNIFRNGSQIATVSANGPLEYDDHLRSAETPDNYLINAVNTSGDISSSVSITLR